MGKLACYCSIGIMAQCVADSTGEQQACHFSKQSANGHRCMHLNENMNNHCWNPEAHEYSKNHGVVRWEDVEVEDEIDLLYDESMELDIGEERRNCRDCLAYTSCSELINLATVATARGGLTEQDLWNQASTCDQYLEETKIDISGGI